MPAASDLRADRARSRPGESMSLLVDVMTDSLDPAYAERAAQPRPRPRGDASSARTGSWTRTLAGGALLVALGLLTGTAVGQVRERAGMDTGLRTDLLAEVRQRTAETDTRARERDRLRTEVDRVRTRALGSDEAGRSVSSELRLLGTLAGTVAVTGPGLVVTLDDAPADAGAVGRPRGGSFTDGRVLDRDLAELVNGLWAAGAEAVAVNGLRLTSLSAIRAAGEAVLVDFRPVSPPYVVEAVGDPAELEVRLLDGPTGRRFATWAQLYGLGFEARREDRLELPAAGVPSLRVASPLPAPGGPP